MEDIKIAAVCMNSQIGRIDENLARTASFVSRASEEGLDIICFPELSITGYTIRKPEEVYSRATSKEIILRIGSIAREAGLIVLAGMVEIPEKGPPFITHIIAGPDGLIGRHRKTHLSPQEKIVFQAGERLDAFRVENACFGVQLCYEAHFPEISTAMALKEADIIFMPHASPRGTPEEKLESWMRHLPARAFDNGMFFVACNQTGKTDNGFSFPGVAIAINPSGWIIKEYTGTGEGMMIAELKGDELNEVRNHRMKYFIPNRRPEIY